MAYTQVRCNGYSLFETLHARVRTGSQTKAETITSRFWTTPNGSPELYTRENNND